MNITFKTYNKNDILDLVNLYINKYSKSRFELRKAKNGILYMYDYDFNEKVSSKEQIRDILSNLNILDIEDEKIQLFLKESKLLYER